MQPEARGGEGKQGFKDTQSVVQSRQRSGRATPGPRSTPGRALRWGRSGGRGGELGGSSSSLLLAAAAANFPWLAPTTCLKALQCRKEIFQEIKLLLFPVWLSSLEHEKKL